ncbi:MAG: hypothetical protein AB1631_17600 [Acidobacteriota bacterium]
MRSKGAKSIPGMRPARTVALLCLIAHALLVNAIHVHITGCQEAAPAGPILKSSHHNDSNSSPASGHTECLSCRLQRNFVSDVRPISYLFDSLPEPLTRELLISEPRLQTFFSIFSSRAPPIV